jgi:predicted  nucleic acid-binding Zn-ribbon protein
MRFQKFMKESSQMIDADAASVTLSSLKKELTRLHGQIKYSEEQIKEAGKNEKDKWAIKEYQTGIDTAKKRIQKVEQQIRDNEKLNEADKS